MMNRRVTKRNGTTMKLWCTRSRRKTAYASWWALALAAACLVAVPATVQSDDAASAKPLSDIKITRVLPPPGIAVDEDVRQELASREAQLRERLAALDPAKTTADDRADVEIFLKAVRLALVNGEFYSPKDIDNARKLLDQAEQRLAALEDGKRPWGEQRGLVVRGFQSKIDGSAQPYGLVIPEGLELKKPVPLYVWLHGRGDKVTDLQFIVQRQNNAGQVTPPDAIVVHPMGRYCNAFKFAGETDVFEAIEAVARNYPIDRDRIVLWGFSMGGAGAWHLGAHYPDHWVAVSPGAGFAETRRYINLSPAQYPPVYQQTLWGMYDAPDYVRNLFNVPVIAYSGEKDRQIQAARVMEEAFQANGHKLKHLIGPDTEHKYHPETLKELKAKIAEIVAKGRDRYPTHVSLQTRTLRYNRCNWVEILRLKEHWNDSRVDAAAGEPGRIRVTTTNVAALRLRSPWREMPNFNEQAVIDIDGQIVRVPDGYRGSTVQLVCREGRWRLADDDLTAAPKPGEPLRKRPGLQGPIDDAFFDAFLVVLPSGKARHGAIESWVQFEAQHFIDRWRALFRGEPRVKLDRDVTEEDLANYHIVVWGDPASNQLLARLADSLPVQWTAETVTAAGQSYPANTHVPAFIYPNPLNPARYVVVNSGITFREGHDRTNSLQIPKLPDWAVIDITTPPDGLAPGNVVAADFFDERWQWKPASKQAKAEAKK